MNTSQSLFHPLCHCVCNKRERGKESEEEEDHMLDVCLFGCQATQRRACGWLVSAVVSNVR